MLSLLVGLLVFPTLQAVLLLLHHHWVNALKMARAQNEQATMPTNQRRLTILTLMAALVMAVEAIVYFYVFFKLLDILAALTMGPSAESVVWYFWYGVGLMHGFSGLVGFFLCVMWIAQMSVVLQSPLDYAWPASPSTCKVPGNLAYIDLEASSYSTLDPIEELNEMTPLIGGTLSNLDVTLPVEPLASVMDSSGPERSQTPSPPCRGIRVEDMTFEEMANSKSLILQAFARRRYRPRSPPSSSCASPGMGRLDVDSEFEDEFTSCEEDDDVDTESNRECAIDDGENSC